MRKVIFLLIIILSLPCTLWAADPIIGTWKFNIEKSDQQVIGIFKDSTEIYKMIESDQIELTRISVNVDGSKVDRKYTWPKQGGEVKGTFSNLKMVELLVAPGEWYAIWLIDGKQTLFIHKVISKDGKTMYQTANGVGRQGEPLIGSKAVFDRQ